MATEWDPAKTSTTIDISNKGRSIDCNFNIYTNNAQTIHAIDGEIYAEFLIDSEDINIGIGAVAAGYDPDTFMGQVGSVGYSPVDGNIYYNGNSIASGLANPGPGDRVCVAYSLVHNKVFFRINNGAWHNSGNPVTGAGGLSFTFDTDYYLAAQIGVTGSSLTLFTAPKDWLYDPPTNYRQINFPTGSHAGVMARFSGKYTLPYTKCITISQPVANNSATFFHTGSQAFTQLTGKIAVHGYNNPSVTLTVYYSTTRTGASNTVIQSSVTVTPSAPVTINYGSTIPANVFIYSTVTAVTGTPEELFVNLVLG